MKQTNKKCICLQLLKEYKKIKDKHDATIIQKTALIVLGSSVIRAFKKGTKKDIIKVLQCISIDDMKKACKSKNKFKKWFIKISRSVNGALRQRKHMKGSKRWAHATKITSLYLRDLLCQGGKRFMKNEYNCVEKTLYVPLDRIVLKKLKDLCKGYDCGAEIPDKMADLKTGKQFFHIQDCLYYHANKAGIPAIWFDDIWAIETLGKLGTFPNGAQ